MNRTASVQNRLETGGFSPNAGLPQFSFGRRLAPLRVPADIRLITAEETQDLPNSSPPEWARIEWPAPVRMSVEGAALDNCLWSFIPLHNTSDAKVFDFARKWGPLGIGDDGMPGSPPGAQQYDGAQWYFERVEDWRRYSRMMLAFVNLADALSRSQPARLDDWKAVLYPRLPTPLNPSTALASYYREWRSDTLWYLPRPPHFMRDRDLRMWLGARDERAIFSGHLSYLLTVARVQPVVLWNSVAGVEPDQQGPSASLTAGTGLFSILVTHLVGVLTSANGSTYCDECGGAYQPTRKPRADRKHYCSVCQREANLAAKRRSWHKNKDQWSSTSKNSHKDAV